jgi:3-hydroxyisobutyrate dehydrogenase-like beta-hydroxyacid dehydrogenase
MKVGWIGLGQMGEAFALQILAGGHELVGHVRSERPRETLTQAGARLTSSLAEAVSGAQIVGVCLFDDAQVREVLLESDVLAGLAPGAVLALHSTGVPAVVEALAKAAPARASVLDATFSGTPETARARQVRLFVGGEAAALERARPVFAAYCDPIFHLGPVGAGRRLKLINNLLFAAQISLAAEGLRAIEQMGLSLETAVEALGLSSGASFALGQFANRDVATVLARLARYMDKDVDAARAAAKAEGLDLSLLSAAARFGGDGG